MRFAWFVLSTLVLSTACHKTPKPDDWSYGVSIAVEKKGDKLRAQDGVVFPSEGKMAFRFWKTGHAKCDDLPSVLETLNFDIPVGADGAPVLGTYGVPLYGAFSAGAENVSVTITAADLEDPKKGVVGSIKANDEWSHTKANGSFTVRMCPSKDKKDEIKPVAAFAKPKKGAFGGTIKGKDWTATHGLAFSNLDGPGIRWILLTEQPVTCDGPADQKNVQVHVGEFGWGDPKSGHQGPQPVKVEIQNLETVNPQGPGWITFDDEEAKPGKKIKGTIVSTPRNKGAFELSGHFEVTVCPSGMKK
jgi:hypothetical protein